MTCENGFIPPSKGLMAFLTPKQTLDYGVFVGVSQGMVRIFSPRTRPSLVEVPITDTKRYSTELDLADYRILRQKPTSWWHGFIVEIEGKEYPVVGAFPSWPTYQSTILKYAGEKGMPEVTDLQSDKLLFVGHVDCPRS